MPETEIAMRPDAPAELLKQISLAISDPGAFLSRQYEDRDGERIYETIPRWGARAVAAAVLPAHEAMVRAKVAEENAAKIVETRDLWSAHEPLDGNACDAADEHNCHRVAGERAFEGALRIVRGDRP